eukprot:CAMPEP_0194534920 /NCGR_PEP_ID=MMETSP0253-20130528/73286_1 /TAXON_ID=2966 /ORGANISM="Noctiluca scintillans" /LENGTH=361 /DNA_ID=CAMNT_0039380627 /DNA_START=11 /DNA_END=1096 /DNA_ORIENTATION=-
MSFHVDVRFAALVVRVVLFATCVVLSSSAVVARDVHMSVDSGASLDEEFGKLESLSETPRLVSNTLNREGRCMLWPLHVPKCGSSFINTIAHYTCPQLPADLEVRFERDALKMSEVCSNEMFGRFQDTDHKPLKGDEPLENVVMMLRNPRQRLLSAYNAWPEALHSCSKLRHKHNCVRPATLDPHPSYETDQKRDLAPCDGDIFDASLHVFTRNSATIPLMEYGACVANCSTNMLSGRRCDEEGPADVMKALNTVEIAGFVGLTDHWFSSICLFHTIFGGTCHPSEMSNTHPGSHARLSKKASYHYDEEAFSHEWYRMSMDEQVYAAAKKRFKLDLERYKLTSKGCSSLCSEDARSFTLLQ